MPKIMVQLPQRRIIAGDLLQTPDREVLRHRGRQVKHGGKAQAKNQVVGGDTYRQGHQRRPYVLELLRGRAGHGASVTKIDFCRLRRTI